ncbi:hydroxyethylthiazole kinase [Rhizosphaericola mali]|uniref:Hydroxyethylthiazole kinase n=1 Tax=Rhizosphaericola mali TaxID=2545455 RepID=A0A5P2FY87_9BACT|nr:hydroxyethylthiazole kinase [Rhizosphaericola mali]QES88145.1 hydroxyethylthiazole kinase [Rhizosphaericola mali]
MDKKIWELISSVRQSSPLILNITNYVVMNNSANALLSIGASPIMSHAITEMEEMLRIANALVINIGTLDENWSKSMLLGAELAMQMDKPWILDPVGAGSTTYRSNISDQLLQFNPTIIRGNASEIMALAKYHNGNTKGVDSCNNSLDAISAAQYLNNKYSSIVCISGEVDIIVSMNDIYYLKNGHALMTKVTGLGCSQSAILGGMIAISKDVILAALAGMALLGVAGELAAAKSAGPGSLQLNLLDKLYNLTESEFIQTIQLSK